MPQEHLQLVKSAIPADEALGHLEDGADQFLGLKLNTVEAATNFKQACELVKIYGKDVAFKLEDLTFESLSGNMVGESRSDGTYLDPEMLRYSPIIQAKIIYHELRHSNKQMMNEGVSEGGAELKFGKDTATHPYVEQVAKYLDFAEMFDAGNNANSGDNKIFELYIARDFEGIYSTYEENHIDALEDDEKDQAFDFFTEVFPELRYGGKKPGYFDLKEVEDELPLVAEPKRDEDEDDDIGARLKNVVGL
jgi:hypothetical protein